MFLVANLFSIFWGLRASSFFRVWFIVELNILTFIAILAFSPTNDLVEPLYFIPQALASSVIFFRICRLAYFSNVTLVYFFLQAAVAAKLGLAPFHSWFVRVSYQISENNFFFLSTTQKLLPIFLFITLRNYFRNIFLLLTVIIRTINAVYQSQILILIAFSSMFTSCWVLSPINFFLGNLYFAVYALGLFNFLKFCKHWNVKFTDTLLGFPPKLTLYFIVRLFLLMGMPPLVRFLPKVLILQNLLTLKILTFSIVLIISSFLYFYVYLNIIITRLNSNLRTQPKQSAEFNWTFLLLGVAITPWPLI